MDPNQQIAIDDTRIWLERAVIGLNLCPFAKSVHVKGQVHYAVSAARSAAELLDDLVDELKALLTTDAALRDTAQILADLAAATATLRRVRDEDAAAAAALEAAARDRG